MCTKALDLQRYIYCFLLFPKKRETVKLSPSIHLPNHPFVHPTHWRCCNSATSKFFGIVWILRCNLPISTIRSVTWAQICSPVLCELYNSATTSPIHPNVSWGCVTSQSVSGAAYWPNYNTRHNQNSNHQANTLQIRFIMIMWPSHLQRWVNSIGSMYNIYGHAVASTIVSHSPTSRIYHTWSLTHQLHSPHMANHPAPSFTTHGHSPTSCTHHTRSLTHQFHSPHMVTHPSVALITHGHSPSICIYHTWPLTQQLHSSQMATHPAAVYSTSGHSSSSCFHHTRSITKHLHSHMVTRPAAAFTTHGNSSITSIHHEWSLTQQLHLTTYGHSPTSWIHHTWPFNGHLHSNYIHHKWSLTQHLHWPHMVTRPAPALTTHGHSLSTCIDHTWPLTQHLHSPHMVTHCSMLVAILPCFNQYQVP